MEHSEEILLCICWVTNFTLNGLGFRCIGCEWITPMNHLRGKLNCNLSAVENNRIFKSRILFVSVLFLCLDLFICVYDLYVCVSPKFTLKFWNLTPKVMVLKRESLRRWVGHEDRALMDGISVQKQPQRVPTLLLHEDIMRRQPSIRNCALTRNQIYLYFDLGIASLSLVRDIFLCF